MPEKAFFPADMPPQKRPHIASKGGRGAAMPLVCPPKRPLMGAPEPKTRIIIIREKVFFRAWAIKPEEK